MAATIVELPASTGQKTPTTALDSADRALQVWIYASISLTIAFCIALGIYFHMQRRKHLHDYEFQRIKDEDEDEDDKGQIDGLNTFDE